MAEGTSIQRSHQFNPLERCGLCHYPTWSMPRRPDEGRYDHSVRIENYGAASSSADQGCDGCKLISEVWRVTIPEATKRQDSILDFDRSEKQLWLQIQERHSAATRVDVFTLHGEPSFMNVRVASLLPPSTHIEHNLARIQTWISACDQGHLECNTPANFTPLRLLDLGCEDAEIVKLVELRPATNVQYACLSHCWGKTISRHITTTKNLTANTNGIPVEELPKTFRDAVSVARALQLRYLWIDSLCIVQDSKPDWATHVEAMAAIYTNGYITLAAGAHDSDDGGFFASTKDVFEDPHLLKLKLGGQVYEVYVRAAVDHPQDPHREATVLPLMKRGWCYQEQLLSRRFLCFGTEILWECLQEVACSCSIASGPFNPRIPGEVPKFHDCPPLKILFSSSDGDHRTVWQDLVSEYTSRQLTYSSDKLPALAGLSTAFKGKFCPGTYHYGMWSSSLHQDLAWTRSGSEMHPEHNRVGPSWSWTQADDGLIFWWFITGDDQYFRLLEITELDSITGDQVHQSPLTALVLSSTLLWISTQLSTESPRQGQSPIHFQICRILEHPEHPRVSLQYDHSPIMLAGDSHEDVDQVSTYHSSPDDESGNFWPDRASWSSEPELQSWHQDFIFLPLGPSTPTIGEDDMRDVLGIALRPVERKVRGKWGGLDIFERIGTLHIIIQAQKVDLAIKGRKREIFLV